MHAKQKDRAEAEWRRSNAEALGIELDSDDEGDAATVRVIENAKKSAKEKRKAKAARAFAKAAAKKAESKSAPKKATAAAAPKKAAGPAPSAPKIELPRKTKKVVGTPLFKK